MMTRILMATILTSALCMTPTASPTIDQSVAKDKSCPETFTLALADGGIAFKPFIQLYSKITKQRVFWDARRIQNKMITGTGKLTFKTEDAERVLQNILFMNDLTVIKMGDPDLRMVKVCDLKTSVNLKAQAKLVSVDELMNGYQGNDVVTVVVPVKNIAPLTACRALGSLVQSHRSSANSPIDEAKLIIVTNFAPQAKKMVRLIQDIDAKADLSAKTAKHNSKPARES